MLYIAWILSVMAGFMLGYYFRKLTVKIEELEEVVKAKVDKPEVIEDPPSTLIDPLDPVKEAMWEHDQLMKKLNP